MRGPFSRSIRVLVVLFAVLALAATACGSAATEVAVTADAAETELAPDDAPSDSGEDGDDGSMADDGGHAHGDMVEVADGLPDPSVVIEATADPGGGWTLQAKPTNHRVAPECASTGPVDGEGHMHLYIDGERIGRLYNEWTAIAPLGEGTHEIRVELSANNHTALAVDGAIVDHAITVEEHAADDSAHHVNDPFEVSDGMPEPSVAIEVFEDPKSGWNVHAVPTNHTLNPLAVSTDAVEGEGHMHLYVDGERVTRLYGEWYHLPDLTDGEHTIRVELSANNHVALSLDGNIIDASATIVQVDGAPGMAMGDHMNGEDHDDMAMGDETTGDAALATLSEADAVITLAVANGSVTGDTGRADIDLGSEVAIVVDGDESEEIHVHGYDVFGAVTPGETTIVSFTADIPGLFEVELEGAGTLLVELAVQ